ncbi:MAG: prepilin peptidase [Opitutaceae bacterium]|nr:prepilin peptidase [Opitutaceae bacterium]
MPEYAAFATAFPWFFPLGAFLLGACIGSFLNVCIHRIPAGESVVTPRSHCACGAPIPWYDNIPIVSWFVLRGRARCCGRRFSFRYPFIEMLAAGLFLACWLLFPPSKALCGMLLCSALIGATFIDLDQMIIPDAFTIWLGVAGMLLSCALPSLHGRQHELFIIASVRSGTDGLIGLLVGSGLVLWIALLAESVLKKEAMGFGDVKFVGAIGAFTGWQGAVAAVFGGAIIGTLWFACVLLWQGLFRHPPSAIETSPPKAGAATQPTAAPAPGTPEPAASEPIGFGVHVPFGPMLAAGGLLYFLVGHRWIDAYFAGIAELL